MQNKEFKSAVGKFPTGVTVISTNYNGKLFGFTANSFVSVSLSPQLVSFCLNRKATSFAAFKNSDSFAISILSHNQADISKHFASSMADKFDSINYMVGSISKAPLIFGAAAFIECKSFNQFECGDHDIFVGEVTRTQIDEEKSPLLYFAKTYLEIK